MSIFKRPLMILVVCILSLQVFSKRSGAASRLTESFFEIMRLATAVAEVEVVKLEQKSGETDWPMMAATLSVKRIYKGDLENKIITVEYIGGNQNNQVVFATGQPKLTLGERAVLLLKKH
jgi:hypothetical protein